MTVETLFPNGDDGGWPTGGFANIDEGIASADGLTYETSIDNDVTVIDLDDSAIADADTVNSVTVKIRAKDTGSGGKNSLIVDLLIGGVGQGPITSGVLNNAYGTYTFVDAVNWDQDWTAAQLDGMQLEITANQTGKGEAADWQIDAIDVDIDYTAAPSGRIMSSLVGGGGLAGPGGMAGEGGGLAA